MGSWGYDLYQNDTACDVKDRFEHLFSKSRTTEECTEQIIVEFSDLIADPEECVLFWISLADIQWDYGVLLPKVKAKALGYIEDCCHQKNLSDEKWHKNQLQKRMLEGVKQKLLQPQPPSRRKKQKRLYRCAWKVGDVYAWQLTSELAREKGLIGRYFLIRKVDEAIWHPGHVVPIIYVKITNDSSLPVCVEEYNALEYVQTSFARYEDRFFPIDGLRPLEDIAEKSKLKYEMDEFGYLPEYRAILLNTSKRIIPTELVYVGNYQEALPPSKEFIPHSPFNLISVPWKKFEITFESKMIKQYCGHNLRELEIYV